MNTEWERDRSLEGETFTVYKEFNGCKYCCFICVSHTSKSTKFWVALSSGKKRKDLQVLEAKENKSSGGIKALIWAKEMVLIFPIYYNRNKPPNKKQYICIGWSDNRRRNIYERLLKEGFSYTMDTGNKILIKKL